MLQPASPGFRCRSPYACPPPRGFCSEHSFVLMECRSLGCAPCRPSALRALGPSGYCRSPGSFRARARCVHLFGRPPSYLAAPPLMAQPRGRVARSSSNLAAPCRGLSAARVVSVRLGSSHGQFAISTPLPSSGADLHSTWLLLAFDAHISLFVLSSLSLPSSTTAPARPSASTPSHPTLLRSLFAPSLAPASALALACCLSSLSCHLLLDNVDLLGRILRFGARRRGSSPRHRASGLCRGRCAGDRRRDRRHPRSRGHGLKYRGRPHRSSGAWPTLWHRLAGFRAVGRPPPFGAPPSRRRLGR